MTVGHRGFGFFPGSALLSCEVCGVRFRAVPLLVGFFSKWRGKKAVIVFVHWLVLVLAFAFGYLSERV